MSAHVRVGAASLAAGVLWIVAWIHLLAAHGTTQVNERNIVLGLTWLDSGRLIAPSLALAGLALWVLAAASGSAALRRAAIAALVAIGIAAIGAVLGFWTQPFGTYEGASREAGVAGVGGGIVVVGSVLMAIALTAYAVIAARAGVLPTWLAALLAIGAILAAPWLYESPQGVALGVALLVLGMERLATSNRT